MKRILIVLTLLCFSIGSAYSQGLKVRRIDLPEGDLKWSYERPKDAKFCVPAAFTDTIGGESKIVGQYRYKGESHQKKNKKMVIVSLKGNMFYISDNWLSDNGFQQWPLVYDSKTIKFNKDPNKEFRRALCKDKNGEVFLLQSNIRMTLTDFAVECGKFSTNAAYLDMGKYGYGYIKKNNIEIPLFVWGIGTQHKQTNWLYIE